MPDTHLGDRGEDAVSPIIGTILMVAVTVILAGVVTGAFLGFKPIPKENVDAAVQVQYDPNGNQVWATYVDKGNSDFINVTFQTGGDEAKVALTNVGSKAIVTAGDGDVTLQGQGTVVRNFTDGGGSAPKKGDNVAVVVTAFKGGEDIEGYEGTVIYTEEGDL